MKYLMILLLVSGCATGSNFGRAFGRGLQTAGNSISQSSKQSKTYNCYQTVDSQHYNCR